MGFTSIWHWLIVLVIVLLLFGAGKLPKVMGDLAKGIKNFKAGLKDEGDDAAAQAPAQPSIPAQPAQPTPAPAQSATQAAPQTPAQPTPGQQP
ncbi:MAG TPA: twin-arginine translocase TatA/TatE family subunit [Azospirillaceae bacterium]|nr:twin-arginine translocase TatA/TatE family subunit [Azospirillaceae bacterium]HRQ80624.1 twin-arginine translocase TatA/TatE family subunit [Azospirillaceae bacterium]